QRERGLAVEEDLLQIVLELEPAHRDAFGLQDRIPALRPLSELEDAVPGEVVAYEMGLHVEDELMRQPGGALGGGARIGRLGRCDGKARTEYPIHGEEG